MGMSANTAMLGVQALGMISGAASASADARSQQRMARLNARLSEMRAEDALQRANAEAARKLAEGNRARAAVKASVAGSGFATGVGTAADAEMAAEYVAAIDAATIRDSGKREAAGHITQAGFDRAQADAISPGMRAASTLIGSATNAAEFWYAKGVNPFKKASKLGEIDLSKLAQPIKG